MVVYNLCTKIPGNDITSEFLVSEVYTETGIAANLQDVMTNLIIDYGVLECNQDDLYHDKTIVGLLEAAKDGRSMYLVVFETDKPSFQITVFVNERNHELVEGWISKRMKQTTGFSLKLRFRSPTLWNHFPPSNATAMTRENKPP